MDAHVMGTVVALLAAAAVGGLVAWRSARQLARAWLSELASEGGGVAGVMIALVAFVAVFAAVYEVAVRGAPHP